MILQKHARGKCEITPLLRAGFWIMLQNYGLPAYNEWSMRFMAAASRFSHLIDSELSYELTKLNNYLAYLSNYLGHWNEKDKAEISEERLKIFGQIIYQDIHKLTLDILEASGSFYSKSIYDESYKPSTINREEFQLPNDFKHLILFSEKDMIKRLIEEK